MTNISDTLTERGRTYGNYWDQAALSQKLLDMMRRTDNWTTMEFDQQDALQMVAVKISRILTGDPDHADNWHDIAGYTTLIERRLNNEALKDAE